MKFLKKLTSKSRTKRGSDSDAGSAQARNIPRYGAPPATDLTKQLPSPVLEYIFSLLCPHSQDDTYESCELSAIENACMLCDLRDLAHCVRVCRRWRKLAANVLYRSIRIDAVHYCEREEILAEKRKRGAFFDRNAEPEDTAQQRLRLLCRTIRNDSSGLMGLMVHYLKIPYMTRETCKIDLARTIAVLPNLRYVDLPDGYFTGDSACNALRDELQVRCLQIRKMTYKHGSERSFEVLGGGTIWQNLEVLDLCNLDLDSETIRYVIGGFPSLRALKLKDLRHDDKLLISMAHVTPFPPLIELLLENTPNISFNALSDYLSRPKVQSRLQTLSLTNSGVSPEYLQDVLSLAPNLEKISLIESVQRPFPSSPKKPLLVSRSLTTLNYEITSDFSGNRRMDPATSYYSYLTSSLLSSGLPSLKSLYVRDPEFADSLLTFVPPRPAFASGGVSRPLNSNNPFAIGETNDYGEGGLGRQLEVYSKAGEEMEWNFSRVEPAQGPGRRGSVTSLRPVSAYGLATSGGQLTSSWAGTFGGRGEVRKSVVVGNGFGGFLAVPADEVRPRSSGGRSLNSATRDTASKYDMWL